MSDLSYVDTICNELLAKCLEHGLPCIPVTDSSCATIIRRLRATIYGSPLNKRKTAASATKKAAPGRETVHGSKVTPAAENVRRTAGKSPSRSGNSNNQSTHSGRRTIANGLDNTSVSGHRPNRNLES